MNEGFKFIFPKKYVIPKSLKVGHWLSELQLKFGMQYPAKKVAQAMHAMACIDWVVYQCLKYYAQFRNPQSLILLPQQFQQFLHWNTCPRCHLLPIASSSSPCPRATERSVRGAMAPTHLVFPSSNECCHTLKFNITWKCPWEGRFRSWTAVFPAVKLPGVYVMLIIANILSIFATKVHPTTSRLLPNKLLWQHLGLPETIANGYPFHAEGCEKLLRRWTTAPWKNLHWAMNWILILDND